MTKEEVNSAVDAYTETVKDRLVKDRYKFFGLFFAGAKNIPSLKWANGGDIKEAVDAKMLAVLGPKDERDVVVKKVLYSMDYHASRITCRMKRRPRRRIRCRIKGKMGGRNRGDRKIFT